MEQWQRCGSREVGVAVALERLGFLPAAECSLERRVFRDDALQEEFGRVGYVVVPLLSASEVALLRDAYAAAADAPEGVNSPGAYNDQFAEFSMIHSRPDFRRTARELIEPVLVPHTDALLVDYRPLISNFVNKPPGKGVVPAHQNLSVVDERRYQSLSVWVALVDAVVGNGAMSMLDGSHRSLRGRRGMWAYQVFSAIEDEDLSEYLTPIEVPAGHAVILDDAVVHYSPPNTTDERRLAIQFVMVPSEADAISFQQVGGDDEVAEVAMWRVQPEFYFEFWDGHGDERYAEPLGHIDVPLPKLDAATLRALLRPEADSPPSAVARWFRPWKPRTSRRSPRR
jgi:ectoine hydroxylase-related dioxygenase (phytanoyl-CoA dioxygenase family)